jgi:hypothetical protein
VTPDNPAHSPLIWLVIVLSLFQIAYLYRAARSARRLPKGGRGAEPARAAAGAPRQAPGWLHEVTEQ